MWKWFRQDQDDGMNTDAQKKNANTAKQNGGWNAMKKAIARTAS
jgi:hypothetical protein